MIPPVQIGISTTLHQKRIIPAEDRCQDTELVQYISDGLGLCSFNQR